MPPEDTQAFVPDYGFQDQSPVPVAVPLIVDLDHTLCRTDTMHEALIGLVASRPRIIASLPFWLASGKKAFKTALADRKIIDPDQLPYDADVIALIEAARAEGRNVALISASEQRQVSAIASHLGLFDEAMGTGSDDAPDNLSGQAKADYLVRRFGAQGFDYIGDSAADVPVWAAARKAYGIRVASSTERQANAQGIRLQRVGDGWSELPALLRACRPHQWAKNLLVLLPVLIAHDPSHLPAALLAMVCFSLTASATYIINDLVDLPLDRAHPRKKHRPFAAGDASARSGVMLAAGLLTVSGLVAAILLPAAFLWTLPIYLFAASAYSFLLKRKMMVDVVALASLYTLRVVAGCTATGIALSPWLLVFSMFLFLSLATIKRQAEVQEMVTRATDKTAGHVLMAGDLPILQAMSVAAAQSAVLVLALYSQDPHVQASFGSPNLLLLICPVLFVWLGRMQMLTRRGHMPDDPIVFTIKDRLGLICVALMLLIFTLAVR
ncbi:MAG: UbiA family prenyltransferase [Gemmobacter sp.]